MVPTAGGQYYVKEINQNPALFVAMIMGNADSNHSEVAPMKTAVKGSRLEVFEFEGKHMWAPAETFEKAMVWLDDKASGKAPATGAATPGRAGSSFDDFFKKK